MVELIVFYINLAYQSSPCHIEIILAEPAKQVPKELEAAKKLSKKRLVKLRK